MLVLVLSDLISLYSDLDGYVDYDSRRAKHFLNGDTLKHIYLSFNSAKFTTVSLLQCVISQL